MASLGDKLVHLSREIEERTKSAELLNQLIHDQCSRHTSEISNFEKEQVNCLAKITSEHAEILDKITNITKPLIDKKNSLEATIHELLAKRRDAEMKKISNIEGTKREISDAKEGAQKRFAQEKSQREKARLAERVAEINRLTWKGIEPNVERLVRKHKDQIEEIKSKSEYSKKKLELQFENDLADKLQAYQRSEDQPNAWMKKRNEFADMFEREQNEQALNVKKLTDKLMNEEESMKKLHSLQLETLVKDNSIELSQIKSSARASELTQNLLAKKRERQGELEATLERACHDTLIKNEWEASWLNASASRVETKQSRMLEELTAWRTAEIDDIIRRSVMDELHH